MKKKVGTFKIWLLAVAAVVAFSVLPKVSSLATEDKALVIEENKQETSAAVGDEPAAGNKQETAEESANLEAQGLEIPVSKVKVSETIRHRLAYTVSYNHDTRQPNWVAPAVSCLFPADDSSPTASAASCIFSFTTSA